jgi:hypothetical protein
VEESNVIGFTSMTSLSVNADVYSGASETPDADWLGGTHFQVMESPSSAAAGVVAASSSCESWHIFLLSLKPLAAMLFHTNF